MFTLYWVLPMLSWNLLVLDNGTYLEFLTLSEITQPLLVGCLWGLPFM
jgi:hypothetical protein